MSALIILALFTVAMWAIERAVYRARRKRRRAEYERRQRRAAEAWGMWCYFASRAIESGQPVPAWREPYEGRR